MKSSRASRAGDFDDDAAPPTVPRVHGDGAQAGGGGDFPEMMPDTPGRSAVAHVQDDRDLAEEKRRAVSGRHSTAPGAFAVKPKSSQSDGVTPSDLGHRNDGNSGFPEPNLQPMESVNEREPAYEQHMTDSEAPPTIAIAAEVVPDQADIEAEVEQRVRERMKNRSQDPMMNGADHPKDGGQGYMSGASYQQDQQQDKGFWTKRNKIILGFVALAVVGAIAAIVVVFTTGGDSSSSDDTPQGLEGTSFNEIWTSEEGVVVGPSYESFTITTLSLCAQQCDESGARAGFFKPSQGLNDPAECICEFDSTCLDPVVQVPGAQVFAQFEQPGQCSSSLCDVDPGDELCTSSTPTTSQPTPTTPTPPTPFPTPSAPATTPVPTPSPPGTPQASLYFTAWFGVTDEDDLCNTPQPGLSISCGAGATLDMLNSTDNTQCTPVGAGGLSCSATFNDIDVSAWVVYACIGTTEQQWTTEVEAIPDTSVQCSNGGAAGTRIFLSQRCPGEDDDFNQMQCNPTSALGTNTDGLNNCLTFDVCSAATCSLATPAVESSIGLSVISQDCLFAVSEGGGPPPTPAPTPVPPTPPTGTAMGAWYQAEWFGVTSEAELCEDPTPGILISCGTGGTISILDTTATATCQILAASEQISCTGTPSEDDFWGILYSCRGNTAASWTTRVEAVPDPSVSCQGGGAAGTRILIGKRCANDDTTDYSDIECDPVDALSVAASGRDSCLAFDICLQETCDLTTLPVAGAISEATIEPACLQP